LHWGFRILDSRERYAKPERTPTSSGIEGITHPKALFYKKVEDRFGLSWTAVTNYQDFTAVVFLLAR